MNKETGTQIQTKKNVWKLEKKIFVFPHQVREGQTDKKVKDRNNYQAKQLNIIITDG